MPAGKYLRCLARRTHRQLRCFITATTHGDSPRKIKTRGNTTVFYNTASPRRRRLTRHFAHMELFAVRRSATGLPCPAAPVSSSSQPRLFSGFPFYCKKVFSPKLSRMVLPRDAKLSVGPGHVPLSSQQYYGICIQAEAQGYSRSAAFHVNLKKLH